MCVMNTDAKNQAVKNPEKCLQEAEKGKADVPGGMPPGEQALLPLFRLDGLISRSGGYINPESVIQLSGHQVAATLL